jgi:hypothetical protein
MEVTCSSDFQQTTWCYSPEYRTPHNHCCENPSPKYMLMSYHQNEGQNHNIKTASRSFKNVAEFRYLEIIVINQNLIHEEMIVQ